MTSQPSAVIRRVRALHARALTLRAIAREVGLAHATVHRILRPEKPWRAAERDPDFDAVFRALLTGSDWMTEWRKYATVCPKPYSSSSFIKRSLAWRRAVSRKGANVTQPVAADEQAPLPIGDQSPAQAPRKPAGGLRIRQEPSPPPMQSLASTASLAASASREPAVLPSVRTQPGLSGNRPSDDIDFPARPLRDGFGAEPLVSSPLEQGLLWIAEPGTALQIRKGSLAVRYRNGFERLFPTRKHGLKTIILNTPGASITVEAARFLIDQNILLTIMRRAGEGIALLTDCPTLKLVGPALALRQAQFARLAQRAKIAKEIVAAKLLAARYEGILDAPTTRGALHQLDHCKTVQDAGVCEAVAAQKYWRHFVGFELRLRGKAPQGWKIFDVRKEKHDGAFTSREVRHPVNSALNYAYAVTLANVTRALVGLGLDPAVGYLHGLKPGRLSLSYDAIELLRPKVDACVFDWAKRRVFERRDFIELPSGQVLLTQPLARALVLQVLKCVPTAECERVAQWLARLLLTRAGENRREGRK
jgi:CRISPR-associated endonuclease Cas1